MKISRVTQLKRGMYKVEIDDGSSFKAHEESLVRYRLVAGTELDQDEYDAVLKAIQYDRAYVDGLKYISYKLRSIQEMRDHLSEDYEAEYVAQAIHRLKDDGYLDDSRYAEALKNTMLLTTDKGPKALERELKNHRVDESIIHPVVEKFDLEIDAERMNKIKNKQLKRHRGAYKQFRMKLQEKLYQRGYNKSHIDMIDFNEDFDETSHFEKDFEKYYNKYNRNGTKAFKQKLIQALMRKGYSYDLIQEKLGGIENEFTEHNDQT